MTGVLVCVGVFVAVDTGVFVEPAGGVFVCVGVFVAVDTGVFVDPAGGVLVCVGVFVAVDTGVFVEVDVGVLVAGETQFGPLMMFDCSVTAPVWARRRPLIVAPVLRVIEARARMLPWKLVVVSSVAEEPIRHQTLQGFPPVTDEPGEVIRVSEALKIQTPDPLRVRLPLTEKETAQYTPGPRGETSVKSWFPL
jgi:hypothetical protein